MAASKITDARSRSAHNIRTARSVVANALLASDRIGRDTATAGEGQQRN